MTRVLPPSLAWLLLSACVTAPETERAPVTGADWDAEIERVNATAVEVARALGEHRFDEVQTRLERNRREQLSAADLGRRWSAVEAECGRLVSVEADPGASLPDDIALYLDPWVEPSRLRCRFERGELSMAVKVELDGTISYLALPRRKTARSGRAACGR